MGRIRAFDGTRWFRVKQKVMKVLIVEDEKIAARRLAGLLEECCPECSIEGILDTVKSTLSWFENNAMPDLAFFDIRLADGNSFEIFANKKITCPVVFTTAYDQYALKAFEVNSIDYLLKPIDREKLERAVNKFRNWPRNQGKNFLNTETIQEALELLGGKNYKERFIVKFGDHLKSIPAVEITCFVSEGKATFFTTRDKKKYLTEYTMDQVEEQVDPLLFFRINRKFIISFDSIKDIVAWSNRRLRLTLHNLDHPDLVVARDKVQDFRKWLDR